jgi:3-dehydroshikimate dehydratase
LATSAVEPQVGLCTISHREKLLDPVLELARELGFDGVEIWGREPHISERFDENRVIAARKMLTERDLTCLALGSYVVFGPSRTKEDDLVSLDDMLQTARTLHTPLMRVWASDVGSAEATAKVWERALAETREACDRAEKFDLVLVAEMHDNTLADTAPTALRFVEEVDRENFRLNFQAASCPGPLSPLERLRQVREYVAHVHLQNFHPLGPEEERYSRAPLPLGVIDYRPLLDELLDNGYAGAFLLEFAAVEGEGKRQSLAQDLTYLRGLLAGVLS